MSDIFERMAAADDPTMLPQHVRLAPAVRAEFNGLLQRAKASHAKAWEHSRSAALGAEFLKLRQRVCQLIDTFTGERIEPFGVPITRPPNIAEAREALRDAIMRWEKMATAPPPLPVLPAAPAFNAHAQMAQWATRGISLAVDDDGQLTVPAGTPLNDTDLYLIRTNKAALAAALTAPRRVIA